MAHLIGEEQIDRFTVIDPEGTLITGETFTADAVYAPDGGLFEYTVTELGSGLYQVTYVQALAGPYYLRLVTNTLTPFQVYEFENDTDALEEGDTATHYFTLRDDDGAYYGGSVVTVSAAYDPSGNVFAPIIDDLGNGLYRVQWETTTHGVYTLRLNATLTDVGDEDQIFEFEDRVLPSTQDEETPFTSVVGSTLDDLVRDVALACRDYLDTEAGVDTDNATWHDDLALAARSPKGFKGASLFIISAASSENIGREVRIRDSVEGAMTVTPVLPAVIRRGDIAYLTNLESSGFTRQTYVNQINARIWGSFPNCLRPAVWIYREDNGGLFDWQYPYLTPPEQFTHLYAVGYPIDAWGPGELSIPMTDENRAGWYWDGANDRIVLQGGYANEAHGREVQIRGFGRWGRLENNSDVTGVDHQWLVEMTSGLMIQSLRDARRLSEAAMHVNRADGYLPKAITQVPAGTIRIR